ncbi:MAG: RodZ domain-containing protein [Thermoleophilia bacterium]
MITIGQRLSDQRRRRGLTLEECEAATHIRGRHLIALEEGRPEDIPDAAYARLFLRGYATFLELDADALVTELDEHMGVRPPREEHRVVPLEPGPAGRTRELRRWLVQPRRRSRRRDATWGAIGLLGALALVIWLGARSGPSGQPAAPRADVPAIATGSAAAPAATSAPARPAPRRVGLVLTGTGANGSWVRVARGGPAGPVAWEGTLAPGQRVRLPVSGTLALRVGWAPSLQVSLGGRDVRLTGGTGDYLVTRAAITPAGGPSAPL